MIGCLRCVRFMKTGGSWPRLISLMMLSCALATQAQRQTARPASHAGAAPVTAEGRVIEVGGAKALIPDAEVFDHSGKRVRLYSDLIKGKVVLLSFFFTDCTNICHTQGYDLSRMQAQLGKRLGKDVWLVSISMNPAHDTPQKLKHWAQVFGVKPGWTLVAGNGEEMRKMIRDFTGNEPGAREVHVASVFIGDDRTGAWVSADGLTGPEELIKVIDSIKKGTAESWSRRYLPFWVGTLRPRTATREMVRPSRHSNMPVRHLLLSLQPCCARYLVGSFRSEQTVRNSSPPTG